MGRTLTYAILLFKLPEGHPRVMVITTMSYDHLTTEQSHPGSRRLDRLTTRQLLRLMNREDARAIQAVTPQLAYVARAIEIIVAALRQQGRLFFVGAGTSGRLGVIEAAECPPTFHTPPSMIQAIIAGGPRAVFRSQEGAEDDRPSARRIIRQRVRAGDVVVGIAASGVTPFVEEALKIATRLGARTILITCAKHSPIPAEVRITLFVGPEVLTGSTRLKAGTATKLVLNMLTLGAMVRLGKTYDNLMVDVRPTSNKLRARARGIIQTLTGCSPRQAQTALSTARGRVKVAVLMLASHVTAQTAQRQLTKTHRSLRTALQILDGSR